MRGGQLNEFSYDYAGRRISTWPAATNAAIEGRIYWDGQQIAFHSDYGFTYFEHQDLEGTDRVRSDPTGAVVATYINLPFGDGNTQTVGGTMVNQDNNSFTSLELDPESETYHAQYRQYGPGAGSWMSPDQYAGSYDMNNPQSFNRYSYVLNNPMTFTDPSGLVTNGELCDSLCSLFEQGLEAAAKAAVDALIGLFGGGGGGSGFHGSLQPRPSVYTFYVSSAPWVRQFDLGLLIPFTGSAPNNPVCGVQVKCRGIEYKHLGLLGAQHCDAQATDSSGVTHSLSGGPDGDPMNSTLNAWDTPNPTIPFTGMTVYNNPNSCSLAACVINSTDQYHNSPGRPHYNGVTGPNSNTWLKGTFSGCGAGVPINTLGGIW